MQEQHNYPYKTWHIGTEIFPNGSSKVSLVSLLRKKPLYSFYGMFWYCDSQARHEKLHHEK